MKKSIANLPIVLLLLIFPLESNAGNMADSHFLFNLNGYSRDSDESVIYLFDNSGTVNSAGDDTPLDSSSSFSDDADTGYLVSGSIPLSGSWSVNGTVLTSEMDRSEQFADSSSRLEIFRGSFTEEFDAASSVRATYQSDLTGEDISAVYRYSDSVDFLFGLGHLSLEERFRIVSDDTGSAGVGVYVINTDNDMFGPHAGFALSQVYSNSLSFYLIGKIGWYDNDSDQRQRVDDTALTRVNGGSGSSTSTLTDIRLGLNYYITQQFAVDFGYQAITVSDVALAERQFDTSQAGRNVVDDSGEIGWDGISLGLRVAF